MWPRAEGTGTISRNETGGCGSKLCYFSVLALEEGRCVHQEVIQSGLELDVFVGSSLVDMYAMCGSMGNACRVFNKMPFRIVVTWSTILGGCGMHGHGSREYGHGNALETACGSMHGFAWRLQNSW
ncbi:hypothetical protein BDL97_17G110500 [Sphagnum fallax]|nr:hypothetical protein BDL97_17G110500 [Sphagnum fallax]